MILEKGKITKEKKKSQENPYLLDVDHSMQTLLT